MLPAASIWIGLVSHLSDMQGARRPEDAPLSTRTGELEGEQLPSMRAVRKSKTPRYNEL